MCIREVVCLLTDKAACPSLLDSAQSLLLVEVCRRGRVRTHLEVSLSSFERGNHAISKMKVEMLSFFPSPFAWLLNFFYCGRVLLRPHYKLTYWGYPFSVFSKVGSGKKGTSRKINRKFELMAVRTERPLSVEKN
jgi:hypothetical protein